MKYLDLHAILFVDITIIQDYWLYWGLPRIQYWEIKHSYLDTFLDDKDDEDKAA